MSKRSTATVRDQPVAGAVKAVGQLIVESETFEVVTVECLELRDVTERVMSAVRSFSVGEGTLHLCSLHTTCMLFINEVQPALLSDFKKFLEQAVDAGDAWMHNDPNFSDCDRANAGAHLRALMLGHSVSLQISGGEVVLGPWQRIVLAELDGPRTRTMRLQVMGVG